MAPSGAAIGAGSGARNGDPNGIGSGDGRAAPNGTRNGSMAGSGSPNGAGTEAAIGTASGARGMDPNLVGSGAETGEPSGAPNGISGVRPSMYEPLNHRRAVNGRQVIQVIGNTLWPACSRPIRKIFELKVDITGCRWSTVTAETKKFYFEEFRKRYYWDEAIEELVKVAWDKLANDRYKDMVYHANSIKEKLPFVPQNIWDEWQKYFSSPEFKARSERNSKNKKGGKDGAGTSCHTGGSIRHVEHARRMANKLGRDPSMHEIFVETHTLKKDKEKFVDEKAHQVNERMVALRQQHLEEQDDNVEELDESQIFLEAAAGKRRDRIYGIGSVAGLYNDMIRGNVSAAPPSQDTSQLVEQVQSLQGTVGSLQEELANLRQYVARDDERMRQLIREMVSNLPTNQTEESSESRPPSPSHL